MSHISPVNLIDQVRSYITHCALLGINTEQTEAFLSQRYGIPPTWTHTVWEMMYQDSLKFSRDNYYAVVTAQQNSHPHMVHGYHHYQPHGYHHQPPPVQHDEYPHMDNGYHQEPLHPYLMPHELQPPPVYPHMVHGYHYQPHEYQEQPPQMGQPPQVDNGYHHPQPHMTYQQRIHAWLLDVNGDHAFPQNDSSNAYNEHQSPSTASSITFPSAASSSSIATNDNAWLK